MYKTITAIALMAGTACSPLAQNIRQPDEAAIVMPDHLPRGSAEVIFALMPKEGEVGCGDGIFSTEYTKCSPGSTIRDDYEKIYDLWRRDQRRSYEPHFRTAWERTLQRIDQNPLNGNGDGVIAPWEIDAVYGSKDRIEN